jgi:hypothetical protein
MRWALLQAGLMAVRLVLTPWDLTSSQYLDPSSPLKHEPIAGGPGLQAVCGKIFSRSNLPDWTLFWSVNLKKRDYSEIEPEMDRRKLDILMDEADMLRRRTIDLSERFFRE